ncbi:hypothetical protein Hanom_Chr04g00346181 [Helianthus anomalus]
MQGSQFETWTKIDLQILLCAPYQDSDLNQRGKGWAFHAKLEMEVKNNFENMKVAESYLRKSHGVRDPHTKRMTKLSSGQQLTRRRSFLLLASLQKEFLRPSNKLDLMSFHKEDTMILVQSQIRTNDQYKICAKSWACAVGNVIKNRLFADVTPLYGGPPN